MTHDIAQIRKDTKEMTERVIGRLYMAGATTKDQDPTTFFRAMQLAMMLPEVVEALIWNTPMHNRDLMIRNVLHASSALDRRSPLHDLLDTCRKSEQISV